VKTSSLCFPAGGSNPPRPRARRRRLAGFTIVEVMMAAIVMAFAITTSITTMQRGFLSLDTARNITIAGQIMQSEFEKMRLVPWATVDAYDATGAEIPLAVDTSFSSNTFIGNRFTMTRRVNVIRTGMKQITLTVTWRSFDGRNISRSYSSYYGQNGLYDYFYNSL
jgi:Tfp pilus assembly protein PilV